MNDMLDLDRLNEIWETITRNKVRSLLTGLGVFWGIFMLIVMMGFGEGLQRGMLKHLDGFATNSCFFFSGRTSMPYKGFQKGRSWEMHNSDVEMIARSVAEIEVLSPMLFGNDGANNVMYNNRAGDYSVRGVHSNYTKIEKQDIVCGRFLNDLDIQHKRKVCVIGLHIYEALFPAHADPLGQAIRVNGIYYQVVGVVDGVSDFSLNGKTADAVAIPFSTMQQVNNAGDVIHILLATVKADASAKQTEEDIVALLKTKNSIAPDDEQAISSFNMAEMFDKMQLTFFAISLLIVIVGSGMLISGIVGVSNIMVVTIKERTKEIGIRRALGAKPWTILSQILSESLLLTAIAGFLGLSAGILFLHYMDIYWIQKVENMYLSDPMVSFSTAIWAGLALIFCGLIAGIIPVMRALQIKAIDAIREE
ncbi:ABC transporter ATP-binding protein [Bacteroidia bacterium]|nr:ABC transporter ATP-binding protein [Bacteroidia bacterium]